MVICLERGADLYSAQLMPLPLTVSCFSKIQIGFTFLVPAHPGSPGQRAVKWVRACVRLRQDKRVHVHGCDVLVPGRTPRGGTSWHHHRSPTSHHRHHQLSVHDQLSSVLSSPALRHSPAHRTCLTDRAFGASSTGGRADM